jgi:hypothetical protein
MAVGALLGAGYAVSKKIDKPEQPPTDPQRLREV